MMQLQQMCEYLFLNPYFELLFVSKKFC